MKYSTEFNRVNTKFSKRNIILYLLGFITTIPADPLDQIDTYFDERINYYQKDNSFVDEISDKDFFQSTRKLIQKEYKKCIKTVEFPKDLLETFIKTYISMNDTDYTLVFTDFYAICRMFMTYDRNKKTPKKCKDEKGKKNTSQYIIYYAGEYHTQNICNFLETMFDVKPTYTTGHKYPNGKNDKLIHINDIKDHKNKKLKDVKCVDDLFKDFYG